MEPFSIVIPTYNRCNIIDATLRSIVAQDYRPIHLILVDNGSEDNTLQYLEEWKSRHEDEGFKVEVYEEKRRGACSARNKGLSKVKSRFMCFFDSDDRMHPELVSAVMDVLLNSDTPDNTVVAWKARYIRNKGGYALPASAKEPLKNHLYHAIVATQRYAASTDLFIKAGGWNESLPCWNDWEFGVRVLLRNPQYCFIDRILVDIHWTNDSITGSRYQDRAGDWEKSIDAIERLLKGADDEYPHTLLPVISFRRAVLAGWYESEMGDCPSQKVLDARDELLYKIRSAPLKKRHMLACMTGRFFASRKWRGMTTLSAPLLK